MKLYNKNAFIVVTHSITMSVSSYISITVFSLLHVHFYINRWNNLDENDHTCVNFLSTYQYRFDAFLTVQTIVLQSSVLETTTLYTEQQNENYRELSTMYRAPAGADFAIV